MKPEIIKNCKIRFDPHATHFEMTTVFLQPELMKDGFDARTELLAIQLNFLQPKEVSQEIEEKAKKLVKEQSKEQLKLHTINNTKAIVLGSPHQDDSNPNDSTRAIKELEEFIYNLD